METRRADQAPERVIAWLRTPEGEQWSQRRISSDLEHWGDGVFGDVIPDAWGRHARTTWPEPGVYDLGDG
jgi:hypothetical protein